MQALLREPVELPALLDKTLEWLQGTDSHGATRRILTLGDAGYPASLLLRRERPHWRCHSLDFNVLETVRDGQPGESSGSKSQLYW